MPQRKRPSKPSPSPEAKPESGKPPKQRAGKKFTPSAEQRRTVEFMAGAGIQEDRMVQLVVNPETKLPIDAKTLRKHFRQELNSGHTKADTMVAQSLFKNATTATKAFPGGIPLAQIFWLKTRARWKPPAAEEPQSPEVSPAERDDADTVRRLAFLLQSGAEATKKKAREPA